MHISIFTHIHVLFLFKYMPLQSRCRCQPCAMHQRTLPPVLVAPAQRPASMRGPPFADCADDTVASLSLIMRAPRSLRSKLMPKIYSASTEAHLAHAGDKPHMLRVQFVGICSHTMFCLSTNSSMQHQCNKKT